MLIKPCIVYIQVQEERDFYITFDYDSLNEQIDYEDDSYAGELIGENSVSE